MAVYLALSYSVTLYGLYGSKYPELSSWVCLVSVTLTEDQENNTWQTENEQRRKRPVRRPAGDENLPVSNETPRGCFISPQCKGRAVHPDVQRSNSWDGFHLNVSQKRQLSSSKRENVHLYSRLAHLLLDQEVDRIH